MPSDSRARRLVNYHFRDYYTVGLEKYLFTYTAVLDGKCGFRATFADECRAGQARPPRTSRHTASCLYQAHLPRARLRLVPGYHGRYRYQLQDAL